MSAQNPTMGDAEERTYADVLNYLRQAEPDQVAAFRRYFQTCKKTDKDKIVGLTGILRALEEVGEKK